MAAAPLAACADAGLTRPALAQVRPISRASLEPFPPVKLHALPIHTGRCANLPLLAQQAAPPPCSHDEWVTTVAAFETRILEIRAAKSEAAPGALALQLHMAAEALERDPVLVAARRGLADEEARAAAAQEELRRKAAAAKAAEDALRERQRIDAILHLPRDSARARVARLEAAYRDVAAKLRVSEACANEAERQRTEVGAPLLAGAVAATRCKAARMMAEEARLRAERASLSSTIGAVGERGRQLEAANVVLRQARAELESLVSRRTADRNELANMLSVLHADEASFASSAASEVAQLEAEAEALRRKLARDTSAAKQLQSRAAVLAEERAALQAEIAKNAGGFQRKFNAIFGSHAAAGD